MCNEVSSVSFGLVRMKTTKKILPGYRVLCICSALTLYFYSFCLVSVLGNDSSKGKEFFWFVFTVFALSS